MRDIRLRRIERINDKVIFSRYYNLKAYPIREISNVKKGEVVLFFVTDAESNYKMPLFNPTNELPIELKPSSYYVLGKFIEYELGTNYISIKAFTSNLCVSTPLFGNYFFKHKYNLWNIAIFAIRLKLDKWKHYLMNIAQKY